MQVTFYGHACFEVKSMNHSLLFDPFITPNPLAGTVDVSALSPNYILLSHGHEDHVADVVTIQEQSKAKLISNYEVVNWFGKQGIEDGHPMNHGGTYNFDFGRVKMVNAVHSSSMPDGSYGGNPAGFVIEVDQKTFYYSGDTALHMDMKLIGESYDIDFALLPVGDNFTMGVEDALIASDFVGTDKIVALHFDTFPYIKMDHAKAKQMAIDAGKTLIILNIGEKINF